MKIRYCKLLVNENEKPLIKHILSGVPQGDPLSSFLFCLAVEPIIKTLKEVGLVLAVYMDDFAIGHLQNQMNSEAVINLMSNEVGKYGMVLNLHKCKSTEKGGEIKFLG